MTTTVECEVCTAPVKPGYEQRVHVNACLAIAAGPPPPPVVSIELAAYCKALNEREQAETHLREATRKGGKPVLPPAATDKKPTPFSMFQRQQGHPSVVPPEGHVLCHTCNGLTYMYPECVPCNGKGWI